MARLCEFTLPVSLHVLEAGEGGGGMSKRSAVSLLFPLVFAVTLFVVPLFEAEMGISNYFFFFALKSS